MLQIMSKSNKIYLLISLLYILFILSCKNDASVQTNTDTPQNNEAIITAALQTVQDSMQLEESVFERITGIMIKYENETKKVQKQQFNNPKSKQQVMQNLLKSRRTELSDVLKPKQVITFNKLYKQNLTNERKSAKEERQLSEEDRKALGQEIQAYRKASVAPVIIEQRKALEAAMSSADKTQIAGLREKMKTFNQSLQDKKTACAAIDKTNRQAAMSCRRELRALQKNYDPIKKEIEELLNLLGEKPGTQTIMSTMETQRKVWRADLKKILEKYSENDVKADKIPLHKYFRTAPASTFIMLNPANVNDSASEGEQ